VSESKLRCDCDPDARPVVRECKTTTEADPQWYVRCDCCEQEGEMCTTQAGARWAWNHRERTVE